MKRIIILLASALALVSCYNDILDEASGVSISMDNTIQVNAMIGSNVLTRVTLPKDTATTSTYLKSFNMTAFNGGSEKFAGVTFTKDEESGKFTPATTQYWATNKFTFVAWAKNNAAVDTSGFLGQHKVKDQQTSAWNPVNNKCTITSGQISSQCGITRYTTEGGQTPTAPDDPVLAINADIEKPANGNSIDLTFQHLLSRVSINICAPYFTEDVCLLDFGFNDVGVAGTFTCKYPKNDNDPQSLTSTADSIPTACWTDVTKGVQGEYQASHTFYWWENHDALIPTALAGNSKYSVAPWLNVIPGSTVADSLYIRFQYKNNNEWSAVTTAKVGLASADVKSYKPGYQYIYNVRMLGQNEDDAEEEWAKIAITSVNVEPWNTTSVSEQNSTNIGIGKSLQDLINELEASNGMGTITLAEDFTLYDSVIVHTPASGKGSDITIDLNGYKITATDTLKKMFSVQNGAKLTFIDSSTDDNNKGTITAGEGNTIVNVRSGGSLTMTDGKFVVTGTDGKVINNESGADKVSVTGGEYSIPENGAGFSGNVEGILSGGTYTGGYEPDDASIKSGYKSLKTANDPVYKVIINGEAFSLTSTKSGDITAD